MDEARCPHDAEGMLAVEPARPGPILPGQDDATLAALSHLFLAREATNRAFVAREATNGAIDERSSLVSSHFAVSAQDKKNTLAKFLLGAPGYLRAGVEPGASLVVADQAVAT